MGGPNYCAPLKPGTAGMNIPANEIVALVMATSFAAGLNVYATLATLGLLSRAGVFELPPSLHGIQSWPVIGACVALFVLEFFADKIPVFDLVWNALHTFVRIPVAAWLAHAATAHLSPEMQLIATIAGGLIAAAAHTGKTAVRIGVTPSPEPLSNIALSTAEDVGAVGLTWVATRHPFLAAAIVVALLITLIVLARFIFQSLKRIFAYFRRRYMGDGESVPT